MRIWSGAIRAAHWSLAAGIGVCLLLHHGGPWHEAAGYAVLAIAGWRVLFGFASRDPFARFDGFVHGPRQTFAYVAALREGRAPRHLGHNPLGGWMIVLLLLAALLAGATGALFDTDRFWGDPTLGTLHEWAGWSFAMLVPLHLAGVVVGSWRERENLVRAMITGEKADRGAESSCPGGHR